MLVYDRPKDVRFRLHPMTTYPVLVQTLVRKGAIQPAERRGALWKFDSPVQRAVLRVNATVPYTTFTVNFLMGERVVGAVTRAGKFPAFLETPWKTQRLAFDGVQIELARGEVREEDPIAVAALEDSYAVNRRPPGHPAMIRQADNKPKAKPPASAAG